MGAGCFVAVSLFAEADGGDAAAPLLSSCEQPSRSSNVADDMPSLPHFIIFIQSFVFQHIQSSLHFEHPGAGCFFQIRCIALKISSF